MKQYLVVKDSPAHPVDIHVGERIRSRRRHLGMSQIDLAIFLGISFQQVQKYERGTNRISASKLYEVATRLRVSVGYFFDGVPSPMMTEADQAAQHDMQQFMGSPDGLDVAQAYLAIGNAKVRSQVLRLMISLANS